MDFSNLKRSDWESLTAKWEAAGIRGVRWLNGEPQFPEGADMERVQEILSTTGASPRTTNQTLPQEAPTPIVEPGPVKQKHSGGWPKGKKRK